MHSPNGKKRAARHARPRALVPPKRILNFVSPIAPGYDSRHVRRVAQRTAPAAGAGTPGSHLFSAAALVLISSGRRRHALSVCQG
jgi:hypothetical protein